MRNQEVVEVVFCSCAQSTTKKIYLQQPKFYVKRRFLSQERRMTRKRKKNIIDFKGDFFIRESKRFARLLSSVFQKYRLERQ